MQILAKTVKKETLFLKLENILCQRSPRIEAVCCCYSVAKSCPTLCDPMNLSMPTFPVLHYLLEFAQTPVHRVSSAVQPSRHLLPPSPPALSLSQHQGLFQRVGFLNQVAKVLALQHQSFQWRKGTKRSMWCLCRSQLKHHCLNRLSPAQLKPSAPV